MKQLIYYPNFESTNETWLKFALLYYNTIKPIIPHSGDKSLSELHHKIADETNLIEPYRPDYKQGYYSTLDAIDIAERLIDDPYKYDIVTGEYNIIKYWRNPANMTYKIYEEKYSHEWEMFCLSNNFGKSVNGGLLISDKLGALYMTVFANTIADAEGIPAITDQKKIYDLSFFLRKQTTKPIKEINNVKSILELKLPKNLNELSFDKIIKLRNTPDFQKSLNAFHRELDNFYENIEGGGSNSKFVTSYQDAFSDYTGQFLKLSADSFKFGLGTSLLLTSRVHAINDILNTVLAGGIVLTITGVTSIRTTWKNTTTKRYCRRYLASLENL
jgi:hypothetical protein